MHKLTEEERLRLRRLDEEREERLFRKRMEELHPPRPPFDWKAHHRDYERKRIEWVRQRMVKQRLVEAGFRALALKAHPDAGGKAEDMRRLTTVRNELVASYKPRAWARHIWTFEWLD